MLWLGVKGSNLKDTARLVPLISENKTEPTQRNLIMLCPNDKSLLSHEKAQEDFIALAFELGKIQK